MSFELLPTVTAWVFGILAVAAAGVLLAVSAAAAFVVRHRRSRLARHESVRTYYRGFALTH